MYVREKVARATSEKMRNVPKSMYVPLAMNKISESTCIDRQHHKIAGRHGVDLLARISGAKPPATASHIYLMVSL
ncbi:hypothetical protein Aduo_018484 [Ancylostoma duodenale]